ncbi:hypothetical protein [Phenylobacterium sp.]|uniref:hypothetical protein n=1 Tax=Phenylobacterium sp. TaxID=1871053 RepID=UPI0025CD5740|nr:hypothetical protein [Phenylobacterium sp.]
MSVALGGGAAAQTYGAGSPTAKSWARAYGTPAPAGATPARPPSPSQPAGTPAFKPYQGPSTYEHKAGQAPYQAGPKLKPYGTSVFGPEGEKKKR